MTKLRTITLTGRPPVKITEDNWPLVASASNREWDGEFDFQANETAKWFAGVRQNADGRIIVYATYSFTSHWRNRRDFSAARGVLLDSHALREKSGDNADMCSTIANVCMDIEECEHRGDDASRWPTLRDDCISDMPAEVL